MKKITLLLFTMVVLFSACSKDDPTDFAGNYTGDVICNAEDPEASTLEISLNTDETYLMVVDNAAGFIGTVDGNELTFERQKPIGTGEYEPYLTGTLTENEDGTFTLSVLIEEEDEQYNCSGIMEKL